MRAQHVAEVLAKHRIRCALVTEGNADSADGIVHITPSVYVQVATLGDDVRVVRIAGRAEKSYPRRDDLTQIVVDVRDALWHDADPDVREDEEGALAWCPRCEEVRRTIDEGTACGTCLLVLP